MFVILMNRHLAPLLGTLIALAFASLAQSACDRGLRRPFFGSGVSCEGVCACRAMEEIKSGLMSEGRDFCFGSAFVCCASVGMIFFILYFDLPV